MLLFLVVGATNSVENAFNTSANFSVTLQIETVDYYGNKRTDGGDPLAVLITDPTSRQQFFKLEEDIVENNNNNNNNGDNNNNNNIVDLKNGSYRFTFTPQQPGRYRIDVNIFGRSIYQMPMYVVARDFVEPLWMFGGGMTGSNGLVSTGGGCGISANGYAGGSATIGHGFGGLAGFASASSSVNGGSSSGASGGAAGINLMRNFSFHNKGATDRDFNMPISVRCVDKLIYVLDSGNNRIKILNRNGQFVGNVKHDGLNESSATALAHQIKNGLFKNSKFYL